MPSSTRRSRRPPSRRVRLLLFPNSRSRSSANGGAAAARSPTTAAGSRPKRGSPSTTAGRASTNCRRSRPRSRSTPRARSSPATTRPISASTARSIPIAAASMAASTASRGRPMPFSACRPGSISNPNCSPSPTRRQLLEKELAAPDYEPRMIAIGTNTDPYQPIERERKIMRGILEVLERAGASGRHRHQIGAGDARHRHPGADGQAQPRQGRAFGDDARSEAGAHHGAAGLDAAEAARGAAAIVGGRNSDHRDGGAGDSRR